MAVRMLTGGLIILSLAAPGVAENVPSPPPDEVIRGLTEQEISALLQGLGMGRARAAELNGYPGPRHVLDLVQAGQLSLGPEKVRTAQHLFDRMAREAQRLGDLILREERSLEAEFRADRISETNLHSRALRIAALEGELRAVHLRAHIEMRAALSGPEIQRYNVLRGYVTAPEHHHKPHP
jgi:hypothetical protein